MQATKKTAASKVKKTVKKGTKVGAKKPVYKKVPKASKTATKKATSKATPKKTEKPIAKVTPKVALNPTPKAPAKTEKPKNQFEGNPYRAGSYYGIAFDCLAKLGVEKPVSRKTLLEAYCKASGKSEKLGRYDMAVILSPTKEGDGHRSSRKNAYWVERLENGLVKLHMASR